MIYVKRYTVEHVITDDADGETTTDDGTLTDERTDAMTFRELVDELNYYPNPSQSHMANANTYAWASSSYTDMHTGNLTECSIHYARENNPRMAKYWVKALRYVFR